MPVSQKCSRLGYLKDDLSCQQPRHAFGAEPSHIEPGICHGRGATLNQQLLLLAIVVNIIKNHLIVIYTFRFLLKRAAWLDEL
jgi:hypothetical protein